MILCNIELIITFRDMLICTYKDDMLIQRKIRSKIHDIKNSSFTQGFIHTISGDYQVFLVPFIIISIVI